MPARFEQALESAGRSMPGRGSGSAHDVLRQVATLRGTYRSWCEQLAAAPGTASLDHNDLHPWNMLIPRLHRPGMVRFYDCGDAVIAHPFAAMLVPLTWTKDRLAAMATSASVSRASSSSATGSSHGNAGSTPVRPPRN
jgi:hypothetical protein